MLLDVDRVLSRLGEPEPRLARLVECRCVAGTSEEETAEALGVGLRTVQRGWMQVPSRRTEEGGAANGDGEL